MIVTARLVDARGAGLAKLRVSLLALRLERNAFSEVPLGEGTSAADGKVRIKAEYPVDANYPRLQLRLVDPSDPQARRPVLAEIPEGFGVSELQLGTVEVVTPPARHFQIGPWIFAGFHAGALAELRAPLDMLVEKLRTQIRGLKERLKRLEAENRALEERVNQLTGENAALAATVSELDGQVATLTAENDALSRQYEACLTRNAELVVENVQLGTAKRELERLIGQLNTEKADLVVRLERALERERELAEEVARLGTEGGELRRQLDEARALREALEADVGRLEARIADLESTSETTQPTSAIVERIGSQVQAAQAALAQSESPFRIGRVAMNMKLVPWQGGDGFSFPSKGEIADGAALSELTFDFTPAPPRSVPAPPSPAALADVVGLTEVMARRRLSAAGHTMVATYQAIADGADLKQHGRVLRQVPAAGVDVAGLSEVLVVIGKKSIP